MIKMRYLGIALLVAFVLTSCAPQATTVPPTPIATTEAPAADVSTLEGWSTLVRSKYEGTEIKVAAATHPSIEAFKKMTPQFQELTGIKVTWDEMEEGQLADKLLLEATSGSTSYDVVMNCPEFTPALVDAGMLEPLDSWLADSEKSPAWFDPQDILAAYRDMLSYQGKHYGIPFAGETVFLFYRKDIFEKHNLKVPQTFDEVLQTAKTIEEKEPGMYGISMRTRLGWEFTYMWSVFIFPFGGRIIDPSTNSPGFNLPGTLESLKYMIELAKYGPTGIEAFSFPEAWDAFMQGKAGMMIEASAAAPEVENPEKSVVAGKVGYAPMPAGPDGAYSGVWGWGFSMTAGSKNKEAAWDFIVYMTSREMQDEYVGNGGIPSRSSWLSDATLQTQYPYYKATLDTLKQAADLQAKGLGVVIMDPRWSQISEIMGTEGAKALAGEITPEQAVENMQSQISETWK